MGGQGPGDPGVALASPWGVRLGHVDGEGSELLGQGSEHLGGIAGAHVQGAQVVAQGGQRAGKVCTCRRSQLLPRPGYDDEQGQDRRAAGLGQGPDQGWVVRGPQVPPEPHHVLHPVDPRWQGVRSHPVLAGRRAVVRDGFCPDAPGATRACPANPDLVGDNEGVSDLIDTTEMYLRTIYELSEEGILPMRARITERLAQSGPTVSQTVARMQRDGLVEIDEDDRHLVLTDSGSALATKVMRKHRLAECLLVEVIGLPWEAVHTEACRWEHVMSESVERRLVEILGHPTTSPFGNPIPGLAELSGSGTARSTSGLPGQSLAVAAQDGPQEMTVVRIAETLQADETTMGALRTMGATPGNRVDVSLAAGGVHIESPEGSLDLSRAQAAQVIVAA